MNFNLVQETELHYHFSATVTTISKSMQVRLICMISWQSSTQMLTNIGSTMPKLFTKQECTKKLRKWLNRLRIKIMRIRYSSSK